VGVEIQRPRDLAGVPRVVVEIGEPLAGLRRAGRRFHLLRERVAPGIGAEIDPELSES
jgi:hypothetical protein